MGNSSSVVALPDVDSLDRQIGAGLRRLRQSRGWSLEELATRSGVSRATLSRLENAEVSATAVALCKLASAFGLTASRLLHQVETEASPLIRRSEQPVWDDPATGFARRAVSPPAQNLAGEVIEGALPAGTVIAYDLPPRPGLEHHLVMLEGALTLTVEGVAHELRPGDCLRYVLHGATRFETPPMLGARYLIFMV
ncbi:helix-turn-helix domain-containing protein [Rhabdaerophilum sp.]|uniref:helix-turn-helix domain-containing protein n=1 Tax=Rhabdaerophilum sp. TaxID=2717341 RepID=UPI0038D36061